MQDARTFDSCPAANSQRRARTKMLVQISVCYELCVLIFHVLLCKRRVLAFVWLKFLLRVLAVFFGGREVAVIIAVIAIIVAGIVRTFKNCTIVFAIVFAIVFFLFLLFFLFLVFFLCGVILFTRFIVCLLPAKRTDEDFESNKKSCGHHALT